MNVRWAMASMALLAGAMAAPVGSGVSAAQSQHPSNERPADVRIEMSNSRKRYDGAYALTGIARVCGVLPAERNFAGVPAFAVHFYPDPPTGKEAVMDVTFDSKELVGNVTVSQRFFLSVSLQSAAIGRPPAYVLDTARPGSKVRGTATLLPAKPGVTVLKVEGADELGATINLTLTCTPGK
jgi:hypothetical protein